LTNFYLYFGTEGVYVDMVEPHVVSKPKNVEPKVHAIDSAEYFVAQKTTRIQMF